MELCSNCSDDEHMKTLVTHCQLILELLLLLFLQPYSYNFTSSGCTPCECNRFGSSSLQCNESGICECKNHTLGEKCDLCEWGFFGLPNATCQGKRQLSLIIKNDRKKKMGMLKERHSLAIPFEFSEILLAAVKRHQHLLQDQLELGRTLYLQIYKASLLQFNNGVVLKCHNIKLVKDLSFFVAETFYAVRACHRKLV